MTAPKKKRAPEPAETPEALDAQLLDACKKHLGIRDLVERSNFLFRAGHYELVAAEDTDDLSDAQGIYRFFLIRSLSRITNLLVTKAPPNEDRRYSVDEFITLCQADVILANLIPFWITAHMAWLLVGKCVRRSWRGKKCFYRVTDVGRQLALDDATLTVGDVTADQELLKLAKKLGSESIGTRVDL